MIRSREAPRPARGRRDPSRCPLAAARSTLRARRPARRRSELLEDLYNGRFGQAYEDLHPAHQALVSRALFIRCARETIRVGRLDSIETLDVFDDETRGLGLGNEPTKAVRIRLTLTDGGSTTFVNHEVKVGERWRWVLNSGGDRAYRAGRCPG